MTDAFTPERRRFLAAAGAGILLVPLAACQTPGPAGRAERESAAAAARVAAIRTAHGLPALRPDGGLETAALRQARLMAQSRRMDHRTGWHKDFAARMKDVDTHGTAAENIARGRFDIDRLLAVWMNSPGHRRNILDARFSRFGLAYVADAADPAERYWAMVLAA